jgi:ribosomal-protein-alanine N-acetyltransferase
LIESISNRQTIIDLSIADFQLVPNYLCKPKNLTNTSTPTILCNMVTPEIETSRLRLRECSLDDLDELSVIRADAQVMKYIGDGKPQSRAQVKEVILEIREHWRNHQFGRWGVEHKAHEKVIGLCGLSHLEDTAEIEIGYTLEKRYWHQGFASEAASACLRYGFEELHLDRVVAVAYPENTGSRRVMEKIGMRYVKTANFYEGLLVYYEILHSDFRPFDSIYKLTR